MPRSAAQLRQIRDERREALLRAARRVFVRKGLADARMADIAAAANASYGLLYHYFRTKEGIYEVLIQGAIKGSLELTAAARVRPGEPVDRLAWLVDEMLRGVREYADAPLLIAEASATQALPPRIRGATRRMAERVLSDIAAVIAEGQAKRQVAPGNPRELAGALIAVVNGVGMGLLRDSRWPIPTVEVVMRLLKHCPM